MINAWAVVYAPNTTSEELESVHETEEKAERACLGMEGCYVVRLAPKRSDSLDRVECPFCAKEFELP